jgi:hypothetical protein
VRESIGADAGGASAAQPETRPARFPAWMTQIAPSLPKLEMLRTEVRAPGNDTRRIRFAVANTGCLPAYVTKLALERKVVRGVMFGIRLPEHPDVSLINGQHRFEGPQLEVHAPKTSQLAFLPSREVTADRAGAVRTEVALD